MRTIAAVVLAGALAACGSSSKNDGGSSGTSVALTGSTAGTLANASSATISGSCTTSALGTATTVQVAVAVVGVTTIADACTALQQGRDVASSTVLGLTIFKVGLGSASVSIAPGTYAFWDPSSGTVPPLDAQGNASFMIGTATKKGGAQSGQVECAKVAEQDLVSGSVTISAISSSQISGTINATLKDGGTVQGSFVAPSCALPVKIDQTTCEPSGVPPTTSCS